MNTQRQRTNETRQAYCQKYDAEIKQWEARLQNLKAESEKMSAEAKLAFMPHLKNADGAMSTARTKWDRLTTAVQLIFNEE